MAYGTVTLNPGADGNEVAVDAIGGSDFQRVKPAFGVEGSATDVSASNPLPTVQTGALPAGTNNIGDVDVLSLPTLPAGDNNIGNVDVVSLPALPAGSNAIGTVTAVGAAAENAAVSGNPVLVAGRYDSSPRTITSGRAAAIALDENGRVQVVGDTNLAAAATGGYTPGYHITEANINAEVIKASAGTLGFLVGINLTADILFLKLYDKATAPDPSADAALLKQIYPIPANTSGAGVALPIPPQGLAFEDGIAFVITDALAPTDETAVAADAGVISYGYN